MTPSEPSQTGPAAESGKGPLFFAVALLLLFCVLRLAGLHQYPVPAVDEGFWSIEPKDALLYGDIDQQRFYQYLRSPLHYAATHAWAHLLPPTLFSVRALSAVVGLLTLLLVWRLLAERWGNGAAFFGLLLLGGSFSLIALSRRAYLEGPLILLSLLAFWCSLRATPAALTGLAFTVALLLGYKSNAIYLLPCLVLPLAGEAFVPGVVRRCVAIGVGGLLAAGIFFLVSHAKPAEFQMIWSFELNKGNDAQALFRIGRFGLYPAAALASLRGLILQHTDLALITVVALGGVLWRRGWRDWFVVKLLLWLAAGYAFLLGQSFQHAQYFLPLIAPAALLLVWFWAEASAAAPGTRRVLTWLAVLIVLSSVARLGLGWQRALANNPTREAVAWLESRQPQPRAFLACPEVAAATTLRGYALNKLLTPYPPEKSPGLVKLYRDKQADFLVLEDCSTINTFQASAEFQRDLAHFEKVTAGKGWAIYRLRADAPAPPKP